MIKPSYGWRFKGSERWSNLPHAVRPECVWFQIPCTSLLSSPKTDPIHGGGVAPRPRHLTASPGSPNSHSLIDLCCQVSLNAGPKGRGKCQLPRWFRGGAPSGQDQAPFCCIWSTEASCPSLRFLLNWAGTCPWSAWSSLEMVFGLWNLHKFLLFLWGLFLA